MLESGHPHTSQPSCYNLSFKHSARRTCDPPPKLPPSRSPPAGVIGLLVTANIQSNIFLDLSSGETRIHTVHAEASDALVRKLMPAQQMTHTHTHRDATQLQHVPTGFIDKQMHGSKRACMHGCVDAWMHGCMDACMAGMMGMHARMDACTCPSTPHPHPHTHTSSYLQTCKPAHLFIQTLLAPRTEVFIQQTIKSAQLDDDFVLPLCWEERAPRSGPSMARHFSTWRATLR